MNCKDFGKVSEECYRHCKSVCPHGKRNGFKENFDSLMRNMLNRMKRIEIDERRKTDADVQSLEQDT